MEVKKELVTNSVFFRKLIENSYEGISLINRDFYVIYRSPSAKKIHGFNEVAPENYNLKDTIHPIDLESVILLLKELMLVPGASKTCDFRLKHASGNYIWIECTYTNMLFEPEINAIVCNFRDISSQKQSSDLLQQSINELSAYKYALDEAAIVAITDQKGIIKHVNANFCKISKYSKEELIGQDHRIINSSYHSKSFIRNLWVTIANGRIWKDEMKNKAKDGSFYWVDTTIIPFLDKRGKPYQYVAIRSDITERKLFQDQIIESERFIKTITDNLPAMIAYWTVDLQCLFANKPFLTWFEKTEKELKDISLRDLMNDEDYLFYAPYVQNVLDGKAQNFERSFLSTSGKNVYFYTQFVPDIQKHTVVGFYSLIYDYSEAKAAEQEISKKTAQIEDLLENITDGFIALDEKMCYTYANKQIGEMLGIDPKTLIGKNIWDLFPDAVGSHTYLAITKAFLEKEYICNEDYYEPLNLWQENRIYPSNNGLSIFIRDISERKDEEIQKTVLSFISQVFNENLNLTESLVKILEQLVNYSNFSIAEAWLVETDKKKINQIAKFYRDKKDEIFFTESNTVKSFIKGDGLPGATWQNKEIQFWPDILKDKRFLRKNAARKAGITSAYGFPLLNNTEVIGVIMLGSKTNTANVSSFTNLFESIGPHLAAEIKHRQLEQELNQVFNFTPDILCIVNIDGYFKKINPSMSILLEFSEEELLSKPFLEFVHPLDKDSTLQELTSIINGKPTYYIENRYITKTGKIKWLAWTTTAASEQGVIYCSAKDITAQKELKELLNKASSLARIGGWEIDLLNKTVYWSEMTKEIHETEPDYTPDFEKGFEFYKEGESRDIMALKLTEVIESGKVCDVELQIVTAKGNTKWIRVVGEAEFSNGICIRVYGSFQDIDALKKTELIAKEILEERNQILESIDDAFFAIDKNWVVTYWNSKAEEILQKPKAEVINHNLWDVFPYAINSLPHEKYKEAIESNEAVHFESFNDNLKSWYEISAYPTGNGLSIYFKDITSRKNSEILLKDLNISLQRQAKELAISNAELEQFAYVASHDLQEPLRMITSFLTQLELKYGDIVDDRGKKYIHFAVDGAKRMRQIILDLLEFSRVGRLEDHREEVDFNKIIKDVLILYRKQIEEQHATIKFEHLPTLFTYKVPIRQIFQNLISNSLKYQQIGNHTQIAISYTENDQHFKFSVRDNGIGIDPEYFDKIFIIFQRLHNKDEYAGTGMGLAVTKKIVESLGGKIWVESEEGKGSTFYFTIKKNKS